eukprot:CAMPEP_0197346808 /NCGR_PEP_ID=MMETSP0893-20130614/6456_1 /TAXON_ID=44058 ORGANISM="Aureoumbra lagunensis, Strain CCMP1510" /NCGR_SAMPLE_ID=MMETSP0893 /ASSEMBLY_ACC=CAM_ASM_000539 /LENGTH=149 /DNA_ID=CAMNT_0042856153 /DNA_START=1 /DNA_END=450 /DNA_ORIENTATION=-
MLICRIERRKNNRLGGEALIRGIMALRKFVTPETGSTNQAIRLFRKICREIPTILTIYDVDMSNREARDVVRKRFQENAHVTDPNTITILCHKGQVGLDEAILQYKTKAQLMAFLEKTEFTEKQIKAMKDPVSRFLAGLDVPDPLAKKM